MFSILFNFLALIGCLLGIQCDVTNLSELQTVKEGV